MTEPYVFKVPPRLPAIVDPDTGTTYGQGMITEGDDGPRFVAMPSIPQVCYEAIWYLGQNNRLRVQVTRNLDTKRTFARVQHDYPGDPKQNITIKSLSWQAGLAVAEVDPAAEFQDTRAARLPFEIDADRVLHEARRILDPDYAKHTSDTVLEVGTKTEAPSGPRVVTGTELFVRIHFSDGTHVDHRVKGQ